MTILPRQSNAIVCVSSCCADGQEDVRVHEADMEHRRAPNAVVTLNGANALGAILGACGAAEGRQGPIPTCNGRRLKVVFVEVRGRFRTS